MSFDSRASLAAMGRQEAGGAVKIWEDLDRYEAAIAAGRPDLLIECGTWMGGSARWFAAQGLDVITIDVGPLKFGADERITQIVGDSASPAVAARVAEMARGRRAMVSLDSDHSPDHVRAEIRLYGALVTPGCHLVAEDGVIRWIPSPFPDRFGGPLDAVEELLADDPRWRRDREVEEMHPVTMSPMGWWQRVA